MTGASKRGWTSFILGAAAAKCDSCVKIEAIMPLVPIIPDLHEGVHRMWQAYGGFSFIFHDYIKHVLPYVDTDAFYNVLEIADVMSNDYLERIEPLAKMIVVSTDDEFMMMDWTNMYYDKIRGEKHLLIAPNTEHSLATGLYSILSGAATFLRSVATNPNHSSRPNFDYDYDPISGEITVTIPEGSPQPLAVYLRHTDTMQGTRRDFRWVVLKDKIVDECKWPYIQLPAVLNNMMIKNFGLPKDEVLCL